MLAKFIEIRDEGTHIPALAIKMCVDGNGGWLDGVQEYYLHYRCGYPRDGSGIVLMMLNDQLATSDPYGWPSLGLGVRTMPTAHCYIIAHFDELRDGDVVDVSFILGETTKPKTSERYSTMGEVA